MTQVELNSLSYWDLKSKYPDKYKRGMKKPQLIDSILNDESEQKESETATEEIVEDIVKEKSDNVSRETMPVRDWSNYIKYWDLKKGNKYDALAKVGDDVDYHEKKQYDFLMKHGLKKEHKFLDIGVGCLRGTMQIVNYLDKGNFFGMDISEEMLKFALERYLDNRRDLGWDGKAPTLIKINDFNFQEDLGLFDFIFANSLVTHLFPKDVEGLFHGVSRILKNDGVFYFTMYPGFQNEGDIGLMLQTKDWIIEAGKKNGLKIKELSGKFENDKPRHKIIETVNSNLPQWVMKGVVL